MPVRPTGFRPPVKWFAKMAQSASASYFDKKLKDLTRAQSAKIGQIVGGIWARYSDKTRMEILRKYEPSAVRANVGVNINIPTTGYSLGSRVSNLSCPVCQTLNPVSRQNVYLRCSKCGTPLRSVRVKKNIKRR